MISFKKEITKLLYTGGLTTEDAVAETELLFGTLTGISKKDLILNPSLKIAPEIKNKIAEIANERILTRKPLQYLLGEAYFMGEEFIVNENVLIPRPETEILVLEALKYAKPNDKILDIGTGSGIIACMLAKLINEISITAVDISQNALAVAAKNAQKLKIESKINFVESNIFSNVHDRFDIIVSNPPYIPLKDKESLQKEVLNYEPHGALFATDINGVEFYKEIIENAPQYLKQNGIIIFELGIHQSSIVKELFEKNKYEVINITKDLSNIERTITAQYKSTN